jgi:hypothetical protein
MFCLWLHQLLFLLLLLLHQLLLLLLMEMAAGSWWRTMALQLWRPMPHVLLATQKHQTSCAA